MRRISPFVESISQCKYDVGPLKSKNDWLEKVLHGLGERLEGLVAGYLGRMQSKASFGSAITRRVITILSSPRSGLSAWFCLFNLLRE